MYVKHAHAQIEHFMNVSTQQMNLIRVIIRNRLLDELVLALHFEFLSQVSKISRLNGSKPTSKKLQLKFLTIYGLKFSLQYRAVRNHIADLFFLRVGKYFASNMYKEGSFSPACLYKRQKRWRQLHQLKFGESRATKGACHTAGIMVSFQ